MHDSRTLTEKFLRYMQTEKRASEHTLQAYRADLADFFDCVFGSREMIETEEITRPLVRRWIAEMTKKGLNPRTVNRRVSALNSFFKYLRRANIVEHNPVAGTVKPKISKRLPVFIPEDKIAAALDFRPDTEKNDYAALRDRVIPELFYATGMRISELVNLRHRDIDFSLRQIKVTGKRNKERIIPMTNNIREILADYTTKKREFFPAPDSDQLFLSASGGKIGTNAVYLIVRKRLQIGGVTGKCNPHVLRHTFATHMLNNGADLTGVKELLGHAGLAATQIYTHNTFEKLKKIHDSAHPRADVK
ncbi:MAG: tyrosine-type recombinase/integrase [Prevotellaceae bacterium]|nr:tyrosine-type recombinase/integrase [Prevotellaceae bacterium]